MAEPRTELVDAMIVARDESKGATRAVKLGWAIKLGEYGVLSKRQIALVVDIPAFYVLDVVDKEDYSGGRFAPESLELIREAIDLLETDEKEAMHKMWAAHKMGTSVTMLSRLTGLTLNTIKGRFIKIRKETEGE